MRTKSPRARAKPATPGVVIISHSAHQALVQMRDHLRLLACFTDHGTLANHLAIRMQPEAMAWCFSRMARDLDEVIGASLPKIN